MNYFSQLLAKAGGPSSPKTAQDHLGDFHKSWESIWNTLVAPDERQLARGVGATDVPAHLKSMVDSLVWESTRVEDVTTGACMEYLLKNDVLATLVKLSEPDRPSGVQAEVLRAISNMVVLLDEQFLVHTAVHKPILSLLRTCVGDEMEEIFDGRQRVMGAAGNAIKPQPSQYEEDLVDLLCTLCSRIRTYRELLMIFFHDKNWFHTHPLSSVEEEEDEDTLHEDDEDEDNGHFLRKPSPSPSQTTIKSPRAEPPALKPEYEFLLFNYLLRFVHREGRIGDFARAGMLFLLDVAMSAEEPLHKLDGERSPVLEGSQVADPIADAALALAEYILEGDFSEVLGAGLSAVYSLLPSKLRVKSDSTIVANQSTSMTLGSMNTESDAEALRSPTLGIGIELSNSPDFRMRLDHFLTMLEFIQDVLRRNVGESGEGGSASAHFGAAIVESVLNAVRRIFLENVLYPSILECSDLDGSSVAVMSYLDVALKSLPDGPLVSLIVDFLTSEGDDSDVTQAKKRPNTLALGVERSVHTAPKSAESERAAKIRKRKSSAMMLLEMEAPEAQKETDYLKSFGRYTLTDLLTANVKSTNVHSSTAAYQLLHTLFIYHCHKSIDRLMKVEPDSTATAFVLMQQFYLSVANTVMEPPPSKNEEEEDLVFVYPGTASSQPEVPLALPSIPSVSHATHAREVELYLGLVARIDPSHAANSFSTGYAHYLEDALQELLSHRCYSRGIDESIQATTLHGHRLNPRDALVTSILQSLCEFFLHPPEFNIALTGVIAGLALCPNRSVTGWLTLLLEERPSHELFKMQNANGDSSTETTVADRIAADDVVLPAASIDENSRPIVHHILWDLVGQLEKYRQEVDNFDLLLRERRQGLLFSENLQDAMDLSFDAHSPFASPAKNQTLRMAPISEVPNKVRHKSKSSLISFLTPTKKSSHRKGTQTPEVQVTPVRGSSDVTAASPFGEHYHSTGSVVVEPLTATMPQRGPWAPPKAQNWTNEEEDVFTSNRHWSGVQQQHEGMAMRFSSPLRDSRDSGQRRKSISLSQLLDNVVILEECMKELAAIIEARRCVGIDSLVYV